MKRIFLLLVTLTSFSFLMAQNIELNSRVYDEVMEAHKDVQAVQFNALQETAATNDWIVNLPEPGPDALFFKYDPAELRSFNAESNQHVELDLPGIFEGLDIKLTEVQLFSPDFTLYEDRGELIRVELDMGTHYRGVIAGQENSLVHISVFGNGVYGSVYSPGLGRWNLGSLEADQIAFVYPEKMQDKGTICATPDDGYVYTMEEITPKLDQRAPGDPVEIFVEADYDVYANKGSLSAATNYMTAVFNEVASLYSMESVTILISDLVIQTKRTRYSGGSSSGFLSAFQRKRTGWNGDLAILVNLANAGGIAASFNGLCNSNRSASMCYAGIDPTYANVPSYSWTVDVFAHELGHLFGSRHTHACVWNGNGTAIDGCYSVEGSCPRPSFRGPGTIMSYCHLSGNLGKDLSQAFGTQPGQVLRNSVASAGCLGGGSGTPHCENGVQDADEEGVDCGGADCDPCPGPCSAPSPVNTTGVKAKQATMNWTAVSGASNYTVQIREVGTSGWSSFSTGNTSLGVRGLQRNATYEWQVKADCSGYSGLCTFTAGGASTQSCGGSQIQDIEFLVYPNPSNGQSTIVYPGTMEGDVSVIVIDELGRVRHQLKISQTIQADFSELNSGLYFIQFMGNGISQTQRLILK